MISLRPSNARGRAEHGWLSARHTFSFAEYHDPVFMGYSALRVINDDTIAPGTGFGMHGHRDMEILTYILEGELEHRDSLGNGAVIRRGDIQVMSAGRGIRHSESNPSDSQPVHLLQIWIQPEASNLEPRYGDRTIPEADMRGRWCLLASPDGREGSMTIRQDACIYATRPLTEQTLTFKLDMSRRYYLHLARGSLQLNGTPLRGGDGAFVVHETELNLSDSHEAEALLFDLP